LSQNQADDQKDKAASSDQEKESAQQRSTQQTQQTPVKKRPIIGKPIGTPIGQPQTPSPPSSTAAPAQVQPTSVQTSQRATPAAATTTVAQRPTIGTPIRPTGQQQPAQVARPVISRPAVATGTVGGRPIVPPKPKEESKQEITRRNFLRGLVIVGGLLALGVSGYGAVSFVNGTVESSGLSKQQIFDAQSNNTLPLTVNSIPENDWRTFIYPRTGNPNIDSDTFSQNVLIHLPKGYVAPSNLSYQDPATGDYYIAFSRVCVHLWCLWSYNPSIKRGACPCHGSQYVPGGPPGSIGAENPGLAVAGPASLQVAPNNQLPIVLLTTDSQGNFYAYGRVGQVGCGQKC
jgi:Rieske Fe-S protein